ncbi:MULTISPECIES: DUF5683 domain-containing protein [unclassified Pedobacter]|uniref:DUF5683 domain-containing protein n=1 Tax=unclassified Pedobacter TaxID=2628915 RepID=UPI0022475BD8|nr:MULTISPECIES: DUF5683 domain-containing protein [unclassified Pedobacter]MCX2432539.1 DUF5683 domain-containing protein [Pedobacter sp. GR22-10]MCX2583372.1 DUF5683 domain-containing protein [Pedobacter sp. MR22-3]
MRILKFLILVSFFTFFLVNLAAAQVRDTVLKQPDTLKSSKDKPVKLDSPKVMSRRDSAKARYVNPGKVAGRKAVFRSMIIPGWGQLYNMSLLNDGYGTRAGKSQTLQKIYTSGKIVAIYGGFTALTLSYIDSRKNYNRFLNEAQYRAANPQKKLDLTQYSDQGVLDGKSLYKRNSQIVIFSYGLLYAANIVDAYVAARLHFFNIDDNLTFQVHPTVISNNTMYGFNAAPALKLSLTF